MGSEPSTLLSHELNQDIYTGFNEKKPASRTVLLQIDLSKAFDMVVLDKLLKDLNQSSLPSFVKQWLFVRAVRNRGLKSIPEEPSPVEDSFLVRDWVGTFQTQSSRIKLPLGQVE